MTRRGFEVKDPDPGQQAPSAPDGQFGAPAEDSPPGWPQACSITVSRKKVGSSSRLRSRPVGPKISPSCRGRGRRVGLPGGRGPVRR